VLTIELTSSGEYPLTQRAEMHKGHVSASLYYNGTAMAKKNQKHDDTSVSLHPLSFDEALKKLSETLPEKPAQRTKSTARVHSPRRKRSVPRPSSSEH